MKLFFLDTETTGTNPDAHSIITFGGIIEIDGEEKERIEFKAAPLKNRFIDPESTKKHGITEEEMKNFPPAEEGYLKLVTACNKYIKRSDRSDRFTISGFKSEFDTNMLISWMAACERYKYALWNCFFPYSLCVLNMTNLLIYMHKLPNFKNRKLETIASHFGMRQGEIHTAMNDIEITKKLFHTLLNLFEPQPHDPLLFQVILELKLINQVDRFFSEGMIKKLKDAGVL